MKTIIKQLGRRRNVEVERPAIVGQLLIVSAGVGTDSTAMLINFKNQGIRPDYILFADTGSEKPETYAYIPVLNNWLKKVGFPELTIVKTQSKKYSSLHENCEVNRTMPSKAYGHGSCSMKWKVAFMDRWINNNIDCQICLQSGMPIVRAIGFDASGADCKRFNKAPKYKEGDKYLEVYPLNEAGIERAQCIKIIEAEGLPQAGKSACFMCPSSHAEELDYLNDEQLSTSLRIEAKALKRTLTEREEFPSTIGLGRGWNWRDYLAGARPELLARLDREMDTGHEAAMWVQQEIVRRAAADTKVFDKMVKVKKALQTKIEKAVQ
jgi:hypothetical protein